MPSPIPFSTPVFGVESVAQVASDRVRVTYTSAPQMTSSSSGADALNPQNYSLSGPLTVAVSAVQAVQGDASSVDLLLSRVMEPGQYSLSVLNVIGA